MCARVCVCDSVCTCIRTHPPTVQMVLIQMCSEYIRYKSVLSLKARWKREVIYSVSRLRMVSFETFVDYRHARSNAAYMLRR